MPKLQPLLKLAPFIGIDTNTSDIEEPGGNAQAAPNADPFRDRGAMSTARGRVSIASLTGSGSITALVPAAITGALRAIYASLSGGTVVQYQPDTPAQYTVTNGHPFTQAFQYGIPVFTDQGQQIRGNNGAAPFKAYSWQNSWSTITVSTLPTWTTAAGTGTAMAAQEYYYAFTILTQYPDGTTQESSPNTSAFAPFSINYTLGSAGAIGITPGTAGTGVAWSGTLADGSTYSTNVYRSSTAQPTFLFLANVTGTQTFTYNDDVADSTITANAQLDLYRDPPPNVPRPNIGSTGGAIFTYKDRAWCWSLVQNANTYNQPQCQLWYSDYGVPYSFNAVYQVILVGNGQTALNPVLGGYGDTPVVGVPLSSCAILHKAKGLYVLWGDDETTFVVRGIGGYGCVSGQSATACATPQGDVDCWLSPDGVYMCDGLSGPQYISEDIRDGLESIPRSDWANAVGWYANRSYYLSFPATGITYIYYFPTRKWRSVPYGTNAAYAQPAEQPPAPANQIYQQVIAARPGDLQIDAWDNAETDLGQQIAASWTSPLSDSGDAFAEKNYRFIGVQNPIQAAGVSATVVLSVYDTGSATPYQTQISFIDLSAATWHIFEVPQGNQKGYLAQLEVFLFNQLNGATAPAELYDVIVGGDISREWAKPV